MNIENTIYQYLSTYTGLTNLVSDRIYPTMPDENPDSLPWVVYTTTGSNKHTSLSGDTGLTNYQMSIETYARTTTDLFAIMQQVQQALHCYSYGEIRGCFLTSGNTDQQEDGWHGSQQFSVWGTV